MPVSQKTLLLIGLAVVTVIMAGYFFRESYSRHANKKDVDSIVQVINSSDSISFTAYEERISCGRGISNGGWGLFAGKTCSHSLTQRIPLGASNVEELKALVQPYSESIKSHGWQQVSASTQDFQDGLFSIRYWATSNCIVGLENFETRLSTQDQVDVTLHVTCSRSVPLST